MKHLDELFEMARDRAKDKGEHFAKIEVSPKGIAFLSEEDSNLVNVGFSGIILAEMALDRKLKVGSETVEGLVFLRKEPRDYAVDMAKSALSFTFEGTILGDVNPALIPVADAILHDVRKGWAETKTFTEEDKDAVIEHQFLEWLEQGPIEIVVEDEDASESAENRQES